MQIFEETRATFRYHASFATPLQQLAAREQKNTPVVLTRLLNEIENRGVDTAGLYYRKFVDTKTLFYFRL